MRAILIDDERLARQELKSLLEPYSGIEIIGETGDPEEAVRMVKEQNPDLLFLDISMPGMNGFELLQKLDKSPEVIFVTAYDEFALKAFEVNAFDYLLKPVEPARLDETLKKILSAEDEAGSTKSSPVTEGGGVLSGTDQVFVRDGEKCWFVSLSEIRLFESEGNYVRVYFEENRPLILKSLNALEEKLSSKEFFRASRKHIINLKWIEGIENWFNGGLLVKLKGGEKVEISRRQSVRFKEMMSL